MKVLLVEALHARPANVLVRVASRLSANIEVRKGDARANAKSILEVLRLGARAGDTIELTISGEGADEAREKLGAFAKGSFDPDLAPETGTAAVPGIAIGHALVVAFEPGPCERGTPAEERARIAEAVAHAKRDIDALVRALPPADAELFEPELAILDDLHARMTALTASGASAEDAVDEATRDAPSDLVIDARTRLIDALRGGGSSLSRALAAREEPELVLVTDSLSPSIVAALPARVTGIVASGGGYASHAAILARSRDLPLLYVEDHVTAGITEGDLVVLDTTSPESAVWVSPGHALVTARRAARAARAAELDASGAVRLDHLAVALRVNVASIHDRVPREASGIGLVRTELLFTGRITAPSSREQGTVFAAIARKVGSAPVIIRLFDAGGDKPIAWLPGAARGIELLFAHPAILAAQLDAIAMARKHGDVRVLIPLARSADDVARVRAGASSVPVGAMIETVDAAKASAAIARASDFVCIGTNDLSASVLGVDRAAAPALEPRVLDIVRDVVVACHAEGKTVTVCGELAGDPLGARALVDLGVDALSVATARLPAVRLALAEMHS